MLRPPLNQLPCLPSTVKAVPSMDRLRLLTAPLVAPPVSAALARRTQRCARPALRLAATAGLLLQPTLFPSPSTVVGVHYFSMPSGRSPCPTAASGCPARAFATRPEASRSSLRVASEGAFAPIAPRPSAPMLRPPPAAALSRHSHPRSPRTAWALILTLAALARSRTTGDDSSTFVRALRRSPPLAATCSRLPALGTCPFWCKPPTAGGT